MNTLKELALIKTDYVVWLKHALESYKNFTSIIQRHTEANKSLNLTILKQRDRDMSCLADEISAINAEYERINHRLPDDILPPDLIHNDPSGEIQKALVDTNKEISNYKKVSKQFETSCLQVVERLESGFGAIGWSSESNADKLLCEHPRSDEIVNIMVGVIDEVILKTGRMTETYKLMTEHMEALNFQAVLELKPKWEKELWEMRGAEWMYTKLVYGSEIPHDEIFAHWGCLINLSENEHLRSLQAKIESAQLRFEAVTYKFDGVYRAAFDELIPYFRTMNKPLYDEFFVNQHPWRPKNARLPWEEE